MAQWNPFEELATLRQEIDRAFEGFSTGQSPLRQVAFLPGTGPRRYPLINLLEDKDHIYIEALTPGVNPQSLNVSVTHNRLTMAGEKTRISGNVKPEAFHRRRYILLLASGLFSARGDRRLLRTSRYGFFCHWSASSCFALIVATRFLHWFVSVWPFPPSERASGKFVRTFDLPVEVDDAGVQAEYKNGLLVVTVPKAEKAKPKQINVKIA
jgi:HSP20 family molecular chaperone IbpA